MKPEERQTGRYGLPLKIKYCKICNISNQQPTSTNEYLHNKDTIQKPLEFSEDEICYACKIYLQLSHQGYFTSDSPLYTS